MVADFDQLLEDSFKDPEMMRELKKKRAVNDERKELLGELTKNFPAAQRELDLHGMTGLEASLELSNFVDRCILQRVLTIRVITGKGLHSKGFKSVLPETTERKLSELRRAHKVFAFKREKTGGAFLVYLVA